MIISDDRKGGSKPVDLSSPARLVHAEARDEKQSRAASLDVDRQPGPARNRALDVLDGNPPSRSGSGHRLEVDVELLRSRAGRRRGIVIAVANANQPSSAECTASTTRDGDGMYASSSTGLNGTGECGAVTRRIGPRNRSNPLSPARAEMSVAIPQRGGASSTTTR